MDTECLVDAQDRTNFFQQGILVSLEYWQPWIDQHITNATKVELERNNIVRAIHLALDLPTAWPVVHHLMTTFSRYMEQSGYWDVWNEKLKQAIEVAQYRADILGQANLSTLLARLLRRQSDFKGAIRCYRQAITLSRQVGDTFGEARACTNLGYILIDQRQWYRAEVLCCHALVLFKQINSDHGLAHTENHLGFLYTQRGLWTQAESHLKRAYTIWLEMGDQHGIMNVCNNLCRLSTDMKQLEQALVYAETAIEHAKLAGEELMIGTIYMNRGLVYHLKGDLLKAETDSRQAETIFRGYANTLGLADVQENLGAIYLDLERWSEAQWYLDTALDAWRSLKNSYGELQTMLYKVKYNLKRGQLQQAQHLLQKIETCLAEDDPANDYHKLQQQVNEYRRSLSPQKAEQTAADGNSQH